MDEISTWQTLINTSATMLGLILVVMPLIVNAHHDKIIRTEDARALIYFAMASFAMFLICLFISTGIVVFQNASKTLKSISVLYFVFGFLSSTIVVIIIVVQWIKNSLE